MGKDSESNLEKIIEICENDKQMVLISGKSCAGKTTLVSFLLNTITQKNHPNRNSKKYKDLTYLLGENKKVLFITDSNFFYVAEMLDPFLIQTNGVVFIERFNPELDLENFSFVVLDVSVNEKELNHISSICRGKATLFVTVSSRPNPAQFGGTSMIAPSKFVHQSFLHLGINKFDYKKSFKIQILKSRNLNIANNSIEIKLSSD